MTLSKKTKEVVKDSIKSAIFIDEKAVEFYESKPDFTTLEGKLSKKLYTDFRKSGISLDIHKFRTSDIIEDELMKRIINKDLVLLDWDLDDGVSGNKYALEILSKIVNQSHIHFCSIYTSSVNLESIIDRISVYFSGHELEYYQEINDNIVDVYYDNNRALFDRINIVDHKKNAPLIKEFKKIDSGLIDLIKSCTGTNALTLALVQLKYAVLGFKRSPSFDFSYSQLPSPYNVNRTSKTLTINNTIVTIIPKTCNNSEKIISKLSSQVKRSDNALMALIGLDMQNNFSKKSSFIDKTLLNVHQHGLMHHRKKSNNADFQLFIKSVLLEHAKSTLDTENLSTLEDTFLDGLTPKRLKHSQIDLSNLNAFYNGSYINEKDSLNFGDILIDRDKDVYYLCITPLCDCLHPKDNIKNNFFFVKGKQGNLGECLKKKDGGFQSYILDGKCINWTQGDYIKPLQIHISNSKYEDNSISGLKINEDELDTINLEYVFTLRQQYAQRITNHTFTHPLRVGVDFVEK